jgi:hypothetical protein
MPNIDDLRPALFKLYSSSNRDLSGQFGIFKGSLTFNIFNNASKSSVFRAAGTDEFRNRMQTICEKILEAGNNTKASFTKAKYNVQNKSYETEATFTLIKNEAGVCVLEVVANGIKERFNFTCSKQLYLGTEYPKDAQSSAIRLRDCIDWLNNNARMMMFWTSEKFKGDKNYHSQNAGATPSNADTSDGADELPF